ncbi:MAG: pseudouridine synthase [Lachnospiraceae bacterium]|nr:pseudouridine synthase [Lachnospiraceae bacterium]
MEETRLNKFLSEMGICSRREADRLVEAGKVMIDGKPAVMGQKVRDGQTVICDGKLVCGGSRSGAAAGGCIQDRAAAGGDSQGRAAAGGDSLKGALADGGIPSGAAAGETPVRRPKPVWLVVNKPRGIVCTTSDKDRAENIVEFLKYPARIYPVGRLDKDSEGLLLMTNQGGLVNQIMRSGNAHEKEYEVRVNKPLTREFLDAMAEGVELKELKQTTRPCEITATGKDSFRIILTQGLNRQIRRMCETLGYRVLELKRVRIMNIRLGSLKTGGFRRMTREEYEEMLWLLEESDSSNLPFAERGLER